MYSLIYKCVVRMQHFFTIFLTFIQKYEIIYWQCGCLDRFQEIVGCSSKHQELHWQSWTFQLHTFVYEQRHEKTKNVAVRHEKTQISLGISSCQSKPWLSAWRKLGSIVLPIERISKILIRLGGCRSVHTQYVGFVMVMHTCVSNDNIIIMLSLLIPEKFCKNML